MSFDFSGAVELRHPSNLSSPPASGSWGSHGSTRTGAGGVLGARQKRSLPLGVRKIDFEDAGLVHLEAEAKRLKTSLSGLVNMKLFGFSPAPLRPLSGPNGGPEAIAKEPPSGPYPAPVEAEPGPNGGPPRARVEESLFPTTYEKEEPKEKQGGSREGAKKRSKEMPAPPAEIAAVVELWLAYKRDRGESYKSASGLTELYKKLSEWGPQRAMAAVKHSMASNWAGVFEANGSGGNGRTREPDIRRTAGAHKEPQIIVNYSRYEPPETKP